MNVTQIFCDADDFCQEFIPNWEKTQLEAEEKAKTRARARSVCESESITLVICYHLSGYRTFKWFYLSLLINSTIRRHLTYIVFNRLRTQ